MKKVLHVFNFSIHNASSESVDIHIDGDIVDASTQEMLRSWLGDDTSVSFKSFRNQINANPAKVYNIYINSDGGLVTDAMAMHDFLIELQDQGKTVNTIGRGIVASAATYILMAGKNCEMSKNSWFMIHNVSGGIWGDVNTIERYAKTLRQFNDRSRDFYAEYTQMRKEDITKLMNEETFFTADQAKEKGFVKNVTGDAAFTNKISKENWQFSNTAVLNAYNSAVKPTPDTSIQNQLEDMKKFFQDLGTSIMNAVKGVKPAENNDQQAMINSIAEAVSKPFETIGDQMETSVGELVKNEVKGEAITNLINASVKTAVDNATKDLTEKITNLEKKNEDLEKEIADNLGNPSNPKNENENTPAPIGGFSK